MDTAKDYQYKKYLFVLVAGIIFGGVLGYKAQPDKSFNNENIVAEEKKLLQDNAKLLRDNNSLKIELERVKRELERFSNPINPIPPISTVSNFRESYVVPWYK